MPVTALETAQPLPGDQKQFLAPERGIAVIVGVPPAEFLRCDGFGRPFGCRDPAGLPEPGGWGRNSYTGGGVVPTTAPPVTRAPRLSLPCRRP